MTLKEEIDDLAKRRNNCHVAMWVMLAIIFILGIGLIISSSSEIKYKKQLEECISQIPTWYLEVECWDDDSTLRVVLKDELDSYELYEAEKDLFINGFDHCVVKDEK